MGKPEATANGGPVLILALPRSFSSITCAMIGQHPQLYGFPELHLFSAETMSEWMNMASRASFSMDHGLLRSVAELFWGEQTEGTVKQARVWLMRRRYYTTAMMLQTLLREVHPRQAVEKGPSLVQDVKVMKRAYRFFPDARFIHLVRHPRTYCESIIRMIREEQAARNHVPRWLLEHLFYPNLYFNGVDLSRVDALASQSSWYSLNANVCEFLESVPESQQMRLRGEDLLGDPDGTLRRVASWLGICTAPESIERMRHPEMGPYAHLGPPGARFGLDPHFLHDPVMRLSSRSKDRSTPELNGLSKEVKDLARNFGYR